MSWLSSMFNPPAANIPLPQMNNYNPSQMGGADAGAFGGIGNLSNFNTYPGMMGQAQDITQGLVNNPGAPSWLSGAQYAGGMAQGGANNAFGAGGNLMGLGMNIAGSAFDPQGALYQRMQQQLQDQTRASQGARGIAMTPYGAGLEDQSMRNFNIDWQNNQLQRQVTGGMAAGALTGQGAGLQAGAPVQYLQGSMMPYGAYSGVGTGQMSALQNYGQFGQQGAQLPQQQIQDYLGYLGWGTGANNAGNAANLGQFNAALNRDKQSFTEQQGIFGGLGNMLGGLWKTPMGSGTVGSSALGGLAGIFSDVRVKDDIELVGELYDGLPVYSYRYKGDPTPRIGLMAQDVERVRPDAVFDVGGIKAVDYGKATEWSRGIASLSAW